MYHLTREERETTATWNMTDEPAIVDTADPRRIRKLDKLVEAYPDIYKCIKSDEKYKAKTYTIANPDLITFRKPKSKAQIESARANINNVNKAR